MNEFSISQLKELGESVFISIKNYLSTKKLFYCCHIFKNFDELKNIKNEARLFENIQSEDKEFIEFIYKYYGEENYKYFFKSQVKTLYPLEILKFAGNLIGYKENFIKITPEINISKNDIISLKSMHKTVIRKIISIRKKNCKVNNWMNDGEEEILVGYKFMHLLLELDENVDISDYRTDVFVHKILKIKNIDD